MKKTFIIVLLFTILLFGQAYSQDTIPTLKGNVAISVKKGTMVCDFYLSNLPNIKDYVIRINSGMNIRLFRDTKSKLSLYYDMDLKDTTSSGETTAYFLQENIGNHNRYLPDEIEFKYGGMYPVITDSLAGFMSADWCGNVAFIENLVRVDSYQSGWYPLLYDMKKQVLYNKVNYDINITCADCSVLYVNGSAPVKGTSAHFVSTSPNTVALFCGNYPATQIGGTWLLNSGMDEAHQREFAAVVNSYQKYYEKNFGIPYKGFMTFAQTKPTAPDHGFSFFNSPTIFNVTSGDYTLQAMLQKPDGDTKKPLIAHELAHYYFGDYMHPNSVFGNVIGEGFAEYLSFKVTKNLIGDSVYRAKIAGKIKDLNYFNFKATPFSKIVKEDDFHNREFYLYYYAPLLFTAIEKEVGEPTMWKWMKIMLTTKAPFTNYPFFEQTFDTAVGDKDKADAIKNKYFRSADALQNAIAEIGSK